MKLIASDTWGTFHGVGALDEALRTAGKGLVRLPVEREGGLRFVYAETGAACSAQEALFHYFGLPLEVIVEPSEWYAYHRKPTLVEASQDRTRVLVRFAAMSSSGEGFGGTCLYACREGQWGAYRIQAEREPGNGKRRGLVGEAGLAGVGVVKMAGDVGLHGFDRGHRRAESLRAASVIAVDREISVYR